MNERSKRECWTILTVPCLLLLSACSTVPEATDRTDRAPANLRGECPPMPAMKPKVLLGDLVEADSALAGQYRECAEKVRSWIEWEAGRQRVDR